MNTLIEQLMTDEGRIMKNGRHICYQDSEGIWTVGYGRNIQERGLSEEEAQMLLRNDIVSAIDDLMDNFSWFPHVGPTRQEVFINMMFNLGLDKFKEFRRMIAAAEIGDYEQVAVEMMDSKWARQVGERAVRLRDKMLAG